jgi:hypothetical protein
MAKELWQNNLRYVIELRTQKNGGFQPINRTAAAGKVKKLWSSQI